MNGNGDIFPLTCDYGQTYVVAVAGRGHSPGHLVGRNAVLIPVTFGEITGNGVHPQVGDTSTSCTLLIPAASRSSLSTNATSSIRVSSLTAATSSSS